MNTLAAICVAQSDGVQIRYAVIGDLKCGVAKFGEFIGGGNRPVAE